MIFHGSGKPYTCVSECFDILWIHANAVPVRQFDDEFDWNIVDASNETSPLSYLIQSELCTGVSATLLGLINIPHTIVHYTRLEWRLSFDFSFLFFETIHNDKVFQSNVKTLFESKREYKEEEEEEDREIETEQKRLEINCKHNDQSCCLSESQKFAVCQNGGHKQLKIRGKKTFDLTMNPKVVFYLCLVKWKFHLNSFISIWWVFWFSSLSQCWYDNVDSLSLSLCSSTVRNQKNFYQLFNSIYRLNMKLFYFIKLNFIKMIFCLFFVRFFSHFVYKSAHNLWEITAIVKTRVHLYCFT